MPEPIAPIKSENIDIRPITIPPKYAAVGIYLFKTSMLVLYWYPLINMPSSLNFLAISLGDSLDTYNQNLSYISIIPREEGATDHHEQCVDQTVERFSYIGEKVFRRRDPVG